MPWVCSQQFYLHRQNLKTIKCPTVVEWTNKICYVHVLASYTIIKRVAYNNMDTFQRLYAEWRKSVAKGNILNHPFIWRETKNKEADYPKLIDVRIPAICGGKGVWEGSWRNCHKCSKSWFGWNYLAFTCKN